MSFGFRHASHLDRNETVGHVNHSPHITQSRRSQTHSSFAYLVDYANPLTSAFVEAAKPFKFLLSIEKNISLASHCSPTLYSSVPTPPPSLA
jgi:hypothetical protein